MSIPKAQPVAKHELREIIENKKSGTILIEGPSACGKTYLLKKLRDTSPRQVRLLSYETVVDTMIENMKNHTYNPNAMADTFSSDVLCIEDIDFLKGKDHTQMEVAFLVNNISENNLVIITGINLKSRVPSLFSFLCDYSYYRYDRSNK